MTTLTVDSANTGTLAPIMNATPTTKTKSIMALPSLAPGRDLDAYMNTIGAIPIMTAEEERTVAERYFYHGDLAAARELVLSHLRFVVHLARSYSGYGLSQSDLIQEGNVGLMKAVKRYDPEKGVRLVSFAVHWIKAEMHEFILRNWRIVKVATTKAQRKLFFNLRSKKNRLGWLTAEETRAVAEELGVPAHEVTRMEGRLTSSDMAFDGYDADDDHAPAPVHFLEDKSANPADIVDSSQWAAASSERLAEAFRELDDRSRDILEQRWLTEDKATLHELASQYDISAERIRQLEKNAMKKLKKLLAA